MSGQRKEQQPPIGMGRGPLGRGPGRGPMGGGMGMPVEKAKDFKSTLKRLLYYLKPHSFMLLVVFVTAALSTIFNILSPKIMGKATTKLFEGVMLKLQGNAGLGIDFSYIINILIILGLLYVSSAFFSFIQQYIMAGIAQGLVYKLRNEVNDKLAHLPLKFFDTRTHGEILSRVTNDIENISTTLQQSMTQLITSVITLIGIVVMMLVISPVMTLIAAVTLPLSFWITAKIAKRSQKYFAAQQKTLGEINGHVEEMYTGHLIVKAFGLEDDSIKKFDNINEKLYEVGWKAQFISGLIMPLLTFVNNLGYVLVSIVGGIYVTKQAIEIGDVQAFIQYTRQFTHPIIQSANIANILQSTIASAERVFELLDETEEIPNSPNTQAISTPQGYVQFKNVTFGYKEDTMVIKDLSIDVQKGQTVAIVGPTGAGKTTLVNLLMRFYEINSGKISIDGIDICNLKRAELRSIFGMVLQDT